MRWASVIAGGVAGSLARWSIEKAFPSSPPAFPWATLVVNVTGAFALGVIAVVLVERIARFAHLRTFLAIGLLGSFTTFSTMAVEGVRLADTGAAATAVLYWVATLVLGQMAGVYGIWIGRWEFAVRKERG